MNKDFVKGAVFAVLMMFMALGYIEAVKAVVLHYAK